MELSIAIINWNTRELLIRCIESIYETTSGVDFELILIDNGSTDGSPQAVRSRFPDVRVVENGENLGFAAACNVALRLARAEYVLLLNSDTLMTDGAVGGLLSYIKGSPQVAICGPQLLNTDGSLQNSIASTPTLATELFNKSLLRRLFPRRYPGKELKIDAPLEVDSIVGAAMMLRKAAVDSVGGFDEDYFFFLEETDLCVRLRQKGWGVVFLPHVRVYHIQGASAKRVNRRARLEYWRSRYIFFIKNHGTGYYYILKGGLFLKAMVELLFYGMANMLTLFGSTGLRDKLVLYATIVAWHVVGCPDGWGLEGRRQR